MTTTGEGLWSTVTDLPIERSTVVSALRGHVQSALRVLSEDHRYDVLLVVTELVSNVLDHTTGDGRLRVLLSRVGCQVAVEVDDCSAQQPVYGESRLGGHRGRGMVMIDNITHAWGARPRAGGGKTVYALVWCAD
ncbi:ATP-binding protein [Lentzea sp. HUAS12]|uniref:ATP-binding protein n=1 Tax=Lentzea sp. HUAS12 TaxID=2951806 RepID=UPI0020A1D82F|nr:ATP-binding protein [Lentzea sp. HUAS12]USX54594.1 ATP-binding protein [Lentzea sp. HUAS12]